MIKIAPSILSADFANLQHEVTKLEKSGANMLHIDVMDGHFVPNLTFGPQIVKAIKPYCNLPFDVHLMVNNPENMIKDFAEAGADIITFHPEATTHIDRILTQIKSHNIKAGIALLPSTSPDIINYIFDKIDLILVMTVNPGFAGQDFLHSQLPKIKYLKEKIELASHHNPKHKPILAIDGGINDVTAKLCIEAGADLLVSGSFIFKNSNYDQQIQLLRNSSKYSDNFSN